MENERKTHQLELGLKQKELELKQKELELKTQEAEGLKMEMEKAENESPELSELYSNLNGAVFIVYTVDENKKVSQGSAFVIDPSGIALSNSHVFENASEAIAMNEKEEKFQISEVLGYDEDLDYFVFRLSPSSKNFDYLEIAQEMTSVGQSCFSIGYPEGLTMTLTNGLISSFRDEVIKQFQSNKPLKLSYYLGT